MANCIQKMSSSAYTDVQSHILVIDNNFPLQKCKV